MQRHSDILVAGAVIGMVVMMVIPLPPRIMDILLSFNLTFALVVLSVTMYTGEPLEFSIFPSLLLLTTLYRLALNVSSTRLILLHGYAGELIRQFGEFVVGGNPVVGFIIFVILVIIQFVVITRGAERVAEVAARFTLDAMPGKQMSIDADLNSGLIDDEEARRRRREIEKEADFYGAMDGASKFVKGDAIAGIIITVINILGGLAVGAGQRGMPVMDALEHYSLMTVGDGLVTQIPALLISTATGIVVTRAASDATLGTDVVGQIFNHPRVLYIAAAVLLVLAVVPGLPMPPFLMLAVGSLFLARSLITVKEREDSEKAAQESQEDREALSSPQAARNLLYVDPLEVEFGYSLLPLADESEGGDLLERVTVIRRQMALELGIIIPLVRFRDNINLKPGEYVIRFRGVVAARGEIMAERYLAMDPGTAAQPIEGIKTKEPAFGVEALWIAVDQREVAERAGYTVVDPASVLATHLTETIRQNAHRLLGRQETRELLDHVAEKHPALVEDVTPARMSLGQVQKVLQELLRERVSIRDMVTILEVLADHADEGVEVDQLVERVRQALGPSLFEEEAESEALKVLTLEPSLEESLRQAVEGGNGELPLSSDRLRSLAQAIREESQKVQVQGVVPTLLTAPLVRTFISRLMEPVMSDLRVVSYAEVPPRWSVEQLGTVNID